MPVPLIGTPAIMQAFGFSLDILPLFGLLFTPFFHVVSCGWIERRRAQKSN